MTVGLSGANVAQAWLRVLRGNSAGTTFTAPAVQAAKLHTADPGAAGATAAAVGDATRKALTFNDATTSGTMGLTASPAAWTNGGTTETITHISVWDATSAGNFMYSAVLTASQPWVSTNTFTLTSLTHTFTPIAA